MLLVDIFSLFSLATELKTKNQMERLNAIIQFMQTDWTQNTILSGLPAKFLCYYTMFFRLGTCLISPGWLVFSWGWTELEKSPSFPGVIWITVAWHELDKEKPLTRRGILKCDEGRIR